MAVQKMEHM